MDRISYLRLDPFCGRGRVKILFGKEKLFADRAIHQICFKMTEKVKGCNHLACSCFQRKGIIVNHTRCHARSNICNKFWIIDVFLVAYTRLLHHRYKKILKLELLRVGLCFVFEDRFSCGNCWYLTSLRWGQTLEVDKER